MIHDSDKADAIATAAEYATMQGWTQTQDDLPSVNELLGESLWFDRLTDALRLAELDASCADSLHDADALQAQLASDNADALHMAAIWEYPQYHAREA